ncbi:MAG: hypothetical protein WHS44_05355 [Fimbriimonadales bacterium]|nr:MAG: hypothetical protein KatS3mg018_2500 [Fimbriimonadales bacterium]
MAIRRLETDRGASRFWMAPIEWVHGRSLRLLEWFNQERWTLVLTLLALLAANLVLLYFFLQGQDNRAIAFVILLLLAPLMWFIPELSIAVFIIAGSRLIVNAMYFAVGPGGGTGERTLTVLFLLIVSARAVYEYLRTPAHERPRLFTWLTAAVFLFWLYYMGHVAYIYLFRYHEVPPDSPMAALGFYRPGIFRYFDSHMLWIGILPLMVLMRNLERAKRALLIVGVVTALGIATLVWEYFAPLPEAWKIVFQIRAAGETTEGYRVRDPAVMYLMVALLFTAIYSLGYLRGWRTALVVLYILAALYGVLITKNRALWATLMPILPLALLWKPPAILARQTVTLAVVSGLFLAGMLNPQFYAIVQQKITETAERWQRNYAYGGDPRNDPSFQWRLREKEAWDVKMSRLSPTERLIGRGLEEPYGFYITLSQAGYGPQYSRVYIEKTQMHFPWLRRQLAIGLIGTALLALTLVVALLRIAWAFLKVSHPFTRSLLMGVGTGTVAAIGYDAIHSGPLDSPPVLPIILLWSLAELTFHWQRTGQLQPQESRTASQLPAES